MSYDYERRSSRYRDDAYDSSRYDDGGRGDRYGREAPYDSLYKRSFEPVDDDQRSTRSGDGRRSHEGIRSRLGHQSYEQDARDGRQQQQVGRPRDDYQDSYKSRDAYDDRDSYGGRSRGSRSQRGYDDYDETSRGSYEGGEDRKQLDGLVGKEKKDIAATVIGALGGAFLGHEASHGKPYGTLGGAVLGGLSANAIEHRHLKHEEARRGEESSSRYGDRDRDDY